MDKQVQEKLLIARVLMNRDRDAFAELIRINQSQLRTFLLRLCHSYDLADDLAQETFVVAYQKLTSFKGLGSFSGWLYRIAYNRFLQSCRDDKRNQEVLSQYGQQITVEADRYEGISDIQIDLENAMSSLNQGESAAITLCHSCGFSHQEIAEILSTPLGTVKSQIKRGKEKLKAVLSESGSESRPANKVAI